MCIYIAVFFPELQWDCVLLPCVLGVVGLAYSFCFIGIDRLSVPRDFDLQFQKTNELVHLALPRTATGIRTRAEQAVQN